MSHNIASWPAEKRQESQWDYQTALWAHQVKKGQTSRENVIMEILEYPDEQQVILTQKFENYLTM
ncbi:DUF3283 family protein [Algicola sagamiensis]|uniref:DUF3283 family protein n=1 Tax=Algicola sagamiensis TaxID=163869 RepID=UPI000379D4E4|nr:DUF3283 family protein [Algicola sagamiensis]